MQSRDAGLSGTAVYTRRDDVVYREIAGERLLVPIRSHVADMQAIFALAGVAAAVWQLLDGTRSLNEVLASIVERYDVTEGAAWKDLCDFVERLHEAGLVERR